MTSPKSGPWKNPAAANGGFEARSLPSRRTARSVRGKNTGGAPGRRHVLLQRGTDPAPRFPPPSRGVFFDNGQGGFPQRGDEEVYQRYYASTRLYRRRHSGRAQREPEPIGRNIVEHGPVLVLDRPAAEPTPHISQLSVRTQDPAVLLNGFRVGARLRLAGP